MGMSMTSRRKFLLSSVAAPAVLVGYGHWLEPRWLKLDHKRCPIAGLEKDQRIRILQLSDLHASSFVPLSWINHAVDIGLAEHPDLICLTGDFITDSGAPFDHADYIRILRRLSAAAPTIAVLGNHDGGLWSVRRHGLADATIVREMLAKADVDLLHNRHRAIEFAHGQAMFAGVGDLWSEEVDTDAAFAGIDTVAPPLIVLAHNPDTKDEIPSHIPWQLMLSGHTHGGQVWIPGYGTPFAPVRDQRYVEGMNRWFNRWIQVCRGVGVTAPIRLYCRPQVSVIDLVPPGLSET